MSREKGARVMGWHLGHGEYCSSRYVMARISGSVEKFGGPVEKFGASKFFCRGSKFSYSGYFLCYGAEYLGKGGVYMHHIGKFMDGGTLAHQNTHLLYDIGGVRAVRMTAEDEAVVW